MNNTNLIPWVFYPTACLTLYTIYIIIDTPPFLVESFVAIKHLQYLTRIVFCIMCLLSYIYIHNDASV